MVFGEEVGKMAAMNLNGWPTRSSFAIFKSTWAKIKSIQLLLKTASTGTLIPSLASLENTTMQDENKHLPYTEFKSATRLRMA